MNIPVNHIEIVNEQAIVGEARVKVKQIVNMHLRGGAPISDVMEQYNLTAAEVHSALAYYYDNQAVFDREYEESQALLQRYGIPADEHLAQLRARRPSEE
jgi:uncharacterized protein (DUF433 family)